jgi:hypothetical protein
MNFNHIKIAVAAQFEKMQKYTMFRVDIDKDKLWQTYLSSFPSGTNPIFKTRTEHDCSCCKQFIRTVGDTIVIIDNKIVSVWDVTVKDYQPIVNAMAKFVKSHQIADVFYHYEKTAGTDKNFEQTTGEVKTWSHFFTNIKPQHVLKKDLIPTKLGELRSTRDVFLRSLAEISDDSIETVLDLISQNSLYRGEEHKSLIVAFKQAKIEYSRLPEVGKILFSWMGTGAVARIRGTVIGTLLQDLTEGKEIDDAVKSYESKVAPMNYKRPTALITKAMIEKAKKTIEENGLTSALERRYATLTDISINNVIFANRNTRKIIDNVFDELTPTAGIKPGSFDKVEEVSIAKFLSDIVPRAESIEVMFENKFRNSLVSLIAPVDATAANLFKWPNKFSWSYNGDVADSIKERVKQAGGNVQGELCCRLGWFNHDDLDLHLLTPAGEIFYGRKKVGYGELDVDMNAHVGTTRNAVENIFFPSRAGMREGQYTLFVRQFRQRETIDVGFEVEMDYLGDVRNFTYNQAVHGDVIVAQFRYTHKEGIQILKSLPSSQTIKTEWNLPTQTFHQVSALMFSPNHWDGKGIGNLHYFFMLEGCKNDGSARGFYNEFLMADLDKHRKVLEVVGSKMKTEADANQLSGLGFSSTQKNTLICRVKGKISRTIKVQI